MIDVPAGSQSVISMLMTRDAKITYIDLNMLLPSILDAMRRISKEKNAIAQEFDEATARFNDSMAKMSGELVAVKAEQTTKIEELKKSMEKMEVEYNKRYNEAIDNMQKKINKLTADRRELLKYAQSTNPTTSNDYVRKYDHLRNQIIKLHSAHTPGLDDPIMTPGNNSIINSTVADSINSTDDANNKLVDVVSEVISEEERPSDREEKRQKLDLQELVSTRCRTWMG